MKPTGGMGTAISLGFFDGVHLGHQAILQKLKRVANDGGLRSIVYTFSNHPLSVLGRGSPPMMQTPSEKYEMLSRLGHHAISMLSFTKEFANTPYEEFIRQLRREHKLKAIVIGFNFCLGRDRLGTPEALCELGNELGVAVHTVAPFTYRGEPISSTRIRACILSGELGQAESMLGRPYSVSGPVENGFRLGRTLGFPTANLFPDPTKAMVPNGVYVTRATIGKRAHESVTNVGIRPTVSEERRLSVETHIMDFHDDIYGRELRVEFLAQLRPERKFGSKEELKAQIAVDAQRARDYFEEVGDE